MMGQPAPDSLAIRPLSPQDATWARSRLVERWGSEKVVVQSDFPARRMPGFVALEAGQPIGLLTYSIANRACEIVTLDSWQKGKEVGAALLNAVEQATRAAGRRRLWLITTNDDTAAWRF